MSRLISDYAQVEISNKVNDILRMLQDFIQVQNPSGLVLM